MPGPMASPGYFRTATCTHHVHCVSHPPRRCSEVLGGLIEVLGGLILPVHRRSGCADIMDPLQQQQVSVYHASSCSCRQHTLHALEAQCGSTVSATDQRFMMDNCHALVCFHTRVPHLNVLRLTVCHVTRRLLVIAVSSTSQNQK